MSVRMDIPSQQMDLSLISETIPSMDIVECRCCFDDQRYVAIVVVYIPPSTSTDTFIRSLRYS